MAKAAKLQKKTPKEPFRWDIFLIDVTTRFGLSGLIIITGIFIFVTKGTITQHREFIDKFFLLKFPKDDIPYPYFILICIAALYFITLFGYKERLKIKNERIQLLENEIKLLQTK